MSASIESSVVIGELLRLAYNDNLRRKASSLLSALSSLQRKTNS